MILLVQFLIIGTRQLYKRIAVPEALQHPTLLSRVDYELEASLALYSLLLRVGLNLAQKLHHQEYSGWSELSSPQQRTCTNQVRFKESFTET